jgi:hypothetical protein
MMFNNLQIVIPSRSRPHKQITISNLSENLWPLISIVVPQEQVDAYRARVPQVISILPCDQPNLTLTRRFVLGLKPTGKLMMIDDDLIFWKRTDTGRFQRITQDTIELTEQMVKTIVEFLDRYPYVGLVDKFMSDLSPRNFKECSRFNEIYGYNRDLFPVPWPEHRVNNEDDHDFHLQLLTRGHKTAVITEYTKSQSRVNSPGGCSEWRSKEQMEETYRIMSEYWPGIVSLTPKPSPFWEFRIRYNWQAARKIGGI